MAMATADILHMATATNGPATITPTASSRMGRALSPFLIPADQLYYWTAAWQAGEAESVADRAAGEVKPFFDATSAIRWLLSNDE